MLVLAASSQLLVVDRRRVGKRNLLLFFISMLFLEIIRVRLRFLKRRFLGGELKQDFYRPDFVFPVSQSSGSM